MNGTVFAYGLFMMFTLMAVYFFVKTFKKGYWDKDSEQPKYQMLEDESVG